ncbi:hypothetical protein AMS68_002301 [Peltaster fructicola]|uniref:Uncharacterized protein n=1 Tax=Peltaster fructicola TaxID=286661 RepID=A0A6H0XPX4_9PEZI|nr:hypothetical protein AMS68_002301 [Peltaster fructicola]
MATISAQEAPVTGRLVDLSDEAHPVDAMLEDSSSSSNNRRTHVPFNVRQSVLNAACYTEGFSDAEKEEVFAGYACKWGFLEMNQDLWRHYYNDVVRPEYLSTRSAAAQVPGSETLASDNDSEDLIGLFDSSAAITSRGTKLESTVAIDRYSGDHLVQDSLLDCVAAAEELEQLDQQILVAAPVLQQHIEAPAKDVVRNRETSDHNTQYHTPDSILLTNNTARTADEAQTVVVSPRQHMTPKYPLEAGIARDPRARNRYPQVRRTVLVSGIPREADLASVLDQIKSDSIVSATYCKTSGMRTRPPLNTNTVILAFSNAEEASAVISTYTTAPLAIDISSGRTVTLHTTLVDSETSSGPRVSSRNGSTSRKLLVFVEPGQYTPQALSTLLLPGFEVLRAGNVSETTIKLEFASMQIAIDAQKKLRIEHGLHGHFYREAQSGQPASP